jgi:hypothetical protein
MSGLAMEARALDANATYHKSRARHHQREARACREKQAQIEAQCRDLGIEIIYQREGEPHGGAVAKSQHDN